MRRREQRCRLEGTGGRRQQGGALGGGGPSCAAGAPTSSVASSDSPLSRPLLASPGAAAARWYAALIACFEQQGWQGLRDCIPSGRRGVERVTVAELAAAVVRR